MHVVVDGLYALLVLLLGELLAELYRGDDRPLLGLAHGALMLGLRLLLHQELRLRRHLDLARLLLDLLASFRYRVRVGVGLGLGLVLGLGLGVGLVLGLG